MKMGLIARTYIVSVFVLVLCLIVVITSDRSYAGEAEYDVQAELRALCTYEDFFETAEALYATEGKIKDVVYDEDSAGYYIHVDSIRDGETWSLLLMQGDKVDKRLLAHLRYTMLDKGIRVLYNEETGEGEHFVLDPVAE